MKKWRNYNIEDIIQSVRKYPHTMIVVNVKGEIKNCQSLKKIPEPIQEFTNLIKQESHKRCAVSFIRKNKKYTKEMALKKIGQSIEALKYTKTHKLRSGVNIPGNEKYYTIKKKLAKRLKMPF